MRINEQAHMCACLCAMTRMQCAKTRTNAQICAMEQTRTIAGLSESLRAHCTKETSPTNWWDLARKEKRLHQHIRETKAGVEIPSHG